MATPSKAAAVRVAKSRPAAKPVAPVETLDIAQQIAWYAILAMVFLVPLAMTNMTIQGSSSPPLTFDQFDTIKVFLQRILGFAALAAWGWHMLTKGGKLRRTPVDWLILAFLGWVAISTIFSIHPPTAIFGKYRRYEGLFSFINYAIAYFLVIQFADRGKRLRQLGQTAFWSAVVVSIYGILQFLGLDFLVWGQLPFEPNRAFSTFGNPDLLGGFIVLVLPVALALVFATEDLRWRIVYWVGFFLIAWCWIVAFTRGAWIGGFVALVVMAFGLIRMKPGWKSVDWAAVALVAVMSVSVIAWSLSSPYEVTNFVKRFQSIFNVQTGSGKTRTEIWEAAVASIKDRPITGFGPDTFRLVFPKYKPAAYTKDAGYISVADNVHDYPLQLASGIGIPGVLLLYAAFIWIAIRSGRVVFKRPKAEPKAGKAGRQNVGPSRDRVILLGYWAACAGYITHLFFGLSVTGSTFLLWVFLGALLAPTATARDIEAPSWGLAPAILLVVLALLNLGFWGRWLYADHRYLQARITANVTERVAAAKAAVRLNPWNDIYRAEVGLAYNDEFVQFYQQGFQAQQAGQNPTQYMQEARLAFSAAEESMKQTIAFVPPEYDNYVFLASLYNLGGAFYADPTYSQRAIQTAKEGMAVEPYGPAIRYQYAQALSQTGQKAEAIKQLQYSLKLDPAFFDGAVLLSRIYLEEKRFDDALAVLNAVAPYAAPKPTESQTISEAIAAAEASRTAAEASATPSR